MKPGGIILLLFATPASHAGGVLDCIRNHDLNANPQLFRMEFDRYSGALNNLCVGVNHYFGDSIGAGIGYNICAMDLDSPDEDLRGAMKLRHHGLIVFAGMRF